MRNSMKSKQRAVAIVLVLLLGAAVYALVRTTDITPKLEAPKSSTALEQGPLVDQTPLLTAQQFAKMPTSAEEQPFAEEALRLGDQEMDLAVAPAVRETQMHPPVLSPRATETHSPSPNIHTS